MKKATFGAGCFWGVEADFHAQKGVLATAVGYEGGDFENPAYEDVCGGRTGHAEVVEVDFDPEMISYEQLLDLFWRLHDPTQVDRQGPDIGSQYRSAIFYHDEEQRAAAEASKQRQNESGAFARPIATVIEAARIFYRGEEYHQQYLAKTGRPHCRTVLPQQDVDA